MRNNKINKAKLVKQIAIYSVIVSIFATPWGVAMIVDFASIMLGRTGPLHRIAPSWLTVVSVTALVVAIVAFVQYLSYKNKNNPNT